MLHWLIVVLLLLVLLHLRLNLLAIKKVGHHLNIEESKLNCLRLLRLSKSDGMQAPNPRINPDIATSQLFEHANQMDGKYKLSQMKEKFMNDDQAARKLRASLIKNS